MQRFFPVLLGLLGLFLSQQTAARSAFGTDLGIGIKGGLNFNKVTGKGWRDVYHTDPHAGLFLHVNRKHIGLQIEGVWTQHRLTVDSSFEGLYSQYLQQGIDSLNAASFRFTTISLPILVNIKLTQFLWVQAGPQFSANVSVTDKNQIVRSGQNIINAQDYSAVGGLWFQFGGKAPLLRVNAGIRYIYGLTNLNRLSMNPMWQNQQVQLHIGISY